MYGEESSRLVKENHVRHQKQVVVVTHKFDSDPLLRIRGVTAKMSLSLSISGHPLVMESPKLGPRVKLFESFSAFNTLTLGLRDSIIKVRPEIERDSVTLLLLHPLAFLLQSSNFLFPSKILDIIDLPVLELAAPESYLAMPKGF